ncbi:hypothetical protein SAMN05216249_10444 [Acetitomaculum ruminis DSM 5522]|uniref:Head domain of trimeric autotransporter adhesin n=1 Tax=Acetitomaculum ruminis DSM 5522 TaxID=1120918 RepID=A0A1I0WEW9_9FIRM|nr:hypothetical protein [Acetitomaculum ruminis]SFA87295.1 hypothetical protein SAMN05216249_10444 [Acetitomaculum ruminis DSM 5522]
MNYTEHLDLIKPEVTDTYNIEDFNTNADLIDEAVGGHVSNRTNPHNVTKSQIGLGNVPNVSTNDQTPTYTEASNLTALTSGESLSTAFGKIKKAVGSLISHLSNTSNPHSVTKSQVGLGSVPNVSTNNQTPTYTEASSLTALTSGESLSTAFGKIKKAVGSLISHLSNTSNPHSVTKSQVGLGSVPNVSTNNQTPTYTEASSLTALASGEYLSTALGKIKKAVNVVISHETGKMNTSNPSGSGSFSLNRKSGTTVGNNSFTEGDDCTASGFCSHAEGNSCIASKDEAHAEGCNCTASGYYSHAEGFGTTASVSCAHAEGCNTIASNSEAHAEGLATTASGSYSHTEGRYTTASNEAAHAEGCNTIASGWYSHAGGWGTKATVKAQTVIGKFNETNSSALFIVGNGSEGVQNAGGSATDSAERSNAFWVNENGIAYVQKTSSGVSSGSKEVLNGGAVYNALNPSQVNVDISTNGSAPSSVTTGSSGAQGVKYIKIGALVVVEYMVNVKSGVNMDSVITIASGLPAAANGSRYWGRTQNQYIAGLQLTTDGELKLEFVRRITDGTKMDPSGLWLQGTITYISR